MRHLQHCHWLHFVLQLPLVMGLSLDRDTIPSSLEKTMFFLLPADINLTVSWLGVEPHIWFPLSVLGTPFTLFLYMILSMLIQSLWIRTWILLSRRHLSRFQLLPVATMIDLLSSSPILERRTLSCHLELSAPKPLILCTLPGLVLSIPIYWKNKLHWWRLAKVLIYG